MMRMTYRSTFGGVVIEDLVGPTGWGAEQYRAAISRQRPGVEILDLEPIAREVNVTSPNGHSWFHVTLRVPGRPITTTFVEARSPWQAHRAALAGVEPGARIIRCVPARG